MIAFGCLLGRGLARQLVAKPSEFIEETKVNIYLKLNLNLNQAGSEKRPRSTFILN